MSDLIEIIIIITAAVLGYKFFTWFSKRTTLLRRLSRLKREQNANITLHSFAYKPIWLTKSTPDITVELGNTIYAIRVYSGIGGARSVHFANEEYSCNYLRFRVSARSPQGSGANSLSMTPGVNLSAKVYRLPPLKVPDEYYGMGKRVVPVMILNPAPSVLSYVTDEKTSIKIAFTGDEMHGMKVFTADSFVRYAERMKREEERLMKDDPNELEYIGKGREGE